MPERYLAIKRSCEKEGGSDKACKTKAAKIFNATRAEGEKPVTGKSEDLEQIVANFLEGININLSRYNPNSKWIGPPTDIEKEHFKKTGTKFPVHVVPSPHREHVAKMDPGRNDKGQKIGGPIHLNPYGMRYTADHHRLAKEPENEVFRNIIAHEIGHHIDFNKGPKGKYLASYQPQHLFRTELRANREGENLARSYGLPPLNKKVRRHNADNAHASAYKRAAEAYGQDETYAAELKNKHEKASQEIIRRRNARSEALEQIVADYLDEGKLANAILALGIGATLASLPSTKVKDTPKQGLLTHQKVRYGDHPVIGVISDPQKEKSIYKYPGTNKIVLRQKLAKLSRNGVPLDPQYAKFAPEVSSPKVPDTQVASRDKMKKLNNSLETIVTNFLTEETRHEYFQKRLKKLGMFDEDSDYDGMLGRAIEELSLVFSKQGHSGMSAAITTQLFNKLMDEWNCPEKRIAENIIFVATNTLTEAKKPKLEPVKSGENRHDYFKRNLKKLGHYNKTGAYSGKLGKSVEQLSDIFGKQGHSRMSSAQAHSLFSKLMKDWYRASRQAEKI